MALAKTLCFAKRPLDGRRMALSLLVCVRGPKAAMAENHTPRPVPPISPKSLAKSDVNKHN